jgi:hypothetical protein
MHWIKRFGSFVGIGVLTATMVLFPAPFCFDCEGFAPYGINAEIVARRADRTAFLYFAIVMLAGVLKIRFTWIVPPTFLFVDLVTQHLAGVPWWTLRLNEGPILVFCDLVVGLLLLGFGHLCRNCFDWLRGTNHRSTANGSDHH